MKLNSIYLRNKIISLCEADPNVACNDSLLVSLIWKEEGWDKYKTIYENLTHCSNSQTILRVRRKLAEEGLIKVDESTRKRRKTEAKKMRKEMAKSWL